MKNRVLNFFIFIIFSLAIVSGYASAENLSGTILETMNSGGYTYVKLKQPQGNIWLAMPVTTLKKGQKASFQPGMVMKDFEAKSMERVFDAIIFSPGLVSNTAAAKNPHGVNPHGDKSINNSTANSSFQAALEAEQSSAAAETVPIEAHQPSPGSTGAIVPSADIQVEKAAGDNSYTVGECFAKAEQLNNSPVIVRGRVLKVSPMIMGRNWVHIQDGTGNPMENTHDLVVTTQQLPETDTIVTFKGTLHANRDFGAGYKYAAIIEDAELQK